MSEGTLEYSQPLLNEADNNEVPRTSERKVLADRLTTFLNSESYLNHLYTFEPSERKKVIGTTLEYGVLHPDMFGMEDFLENLTREEGRQDKAIAIAMVRSIAKRLDVDPSTKEGKEAVFSYYNEKVETNGVRYHGFNGAFKPQIEDDGLVTDERVWEVEDLEKVHQIGNKTGNTMLLGWGKINSEGKLFYSATPNVSYRYAVASPEWFAQFTSEGSHVKSEPKKKEAFYRRDYDSARQNIIDLCDKLQSNTADAILARKAYPNITNEEREYLLQFFDKYWSALAGPDSQPSLALIDMNVLGVGDPFTFDDIAEFTRKDVENITVEDAIDFVRRYNGGIIDGRTDQNIPPDRFSIVTLPNYNTVFPQIT